MRLLEERPAVRAYWVVFSSNATRRREALRSAHLFLKNAKSKRVIVQSYKDGFFPYQGQKIKREFERLKKQIDPDVIFTHYRHDLHQDHRLLNELTWNTFRGHLILEYEIPKYDGDLGSPNFFSQLDETVCRMKVDYLQRAFASQRKRHWFNGELFFALMRLRGMEAHSPTRFAEGFYVRKLCL